MRYSTIKHVHFVGIGGIGMSGIAEILLTQGFTVSGSDIQKSETTDYLESKGATIYVGHEASYIQDAQVVVYSSAVNATTNPETSAARERGIPIIRRAEMLSEVSRLKYTLAIAGTHGKTTTTCMVGLILMKSEIDPTIIVGGKVRNLGGTNARLGNGDWIVLEADEYDRSFLQLLPTIAIITNVEADHLDIYTDLDDIKGAFVEFVRKVPFYGAACVCLDDPGVRSIMPSMHKNVKTYGTSAQCDVRASNIKAEGRTTSFTLIHQDTELGTVTLNVPGEHNIRNALGAATAALQLGVRPEIIIEALGEFTGVNRRFEVLGEVDGVLVIDDYAHHPTEVRATLAAARSGWNRRIVAIFQPHTYTRTRDFAQDFATSFYDADVLIITNVYAAREEPIPGVDGSMIAEAARAAGHKSVHYVPDLHSIHDALSTIVRSGDVVITLGAGNISRIARDMIA